MKGGRGKGEEEKMDGERGKEKEMEREKWRTGRREEGGRRKREGREGRGNRGENGERKERVRNGRREPKKTVQKPLHTQLQ